MLLFQPIFKTFRVTAGITEKIIAWESKWFTNEKVKPPTTANISLSPKLKWHKLKIIVEYKGSFLEQGKVTFTLRNVVNSFNVYE